MANSPEMDHCEILILQISDIDSSNLRW